MDNQFFRNLSNRLEKIVSEEHDSETVDSGELKVHDYQTRHFDMCPSAADLYRNIDEKTSDDDLAERTAKLQDVLFYLEKHTVKEMKSATNEDVLMAEVLAEQIMTMAGMMNLKDEHSYIQSHVDAIEAVASKSDSVKENTDMKITEINNNEITLEDTQDFHKEFGYLAYSIDENDLFEAEYQGRKVKLNKPIRSSNGPKKFHVYVKNDKGNVVKVNFGDPNMEIKADDPERRKSFRARHNCDSPGPKHKARYWSCRAW